MSAEDRADQVLLSQLPIRELPVPAPFNPAEFLLPGNAVVSRCDRVYGFYDGSTLSGLVWWQGRQWQLYQGVSRDQFFLGVFPAIVEALKAHLPAVMEIEA